jgi:hypothetical protein
MAVITFTKLIDTGINKSQLDNSQGFGSYQVAVELAGTNCIEVQYSANAGATWNGYSRSATAYALSYNLYIPNRGDLGSTTNDVDLFSSGLPTLKTNRIYIATNVEIYNWSNIAAAVGDATYRVRVDNFAWRIYRV